MLKVNPLELPNREREIKLLQGEGGFSSRDALKNILKIDPIAPDRDDGALLEVSAKTGDLPKALKNFSQVDYVLTEGSNKDRRVIRIKGGTHNTSTPTKLVKETMAGSTFKDLGQRVDGEHKKKRREWVSLSKPMSMHNGISGDAIKEMHT
jgi:hypothetical protein